MHFRNLTSHGVEVIRLGQTQQSSDALQIRVNQRDGDERRDRTPYHYMYGHMYGRPEVGRLVLSAALIGIIGSIPENTGPDDCNAGDELNLHGCTPWPNRSVVCAFPGQMAGRGISRGSQDRAFSESLTIRPEGDPFTSVHRAFQPSGPPTIPFSRTSPLTDRVLATPDARFENVPHFKDHRSFKLCDKLFRLGGRRCYSLPA